jgi:hydrogenase expression/formation protein HypD
MKDAGAHTESNAYADPRAVAGLIQEITKAARLLRSTATLMEVCGTHTHAIAEAGLRRLLPPTVRLVSGPGCPVCVTPVGYLDRAECLAALPGVILCTFGDLLRVPSSRASLEQIRADGRDVRVVYSARDALAVARENLQKRVIFLAVGFETTAPTIAAALDEAIRGRVDNFLLLPGNKLIPPPMLALVRDVDVHVDGFLLPGHVSVVTGSNAFTFLAEEHGIPCAVSGFAPTDVCRSVLELVRQHHEGRAAVTNCYSRVVTPEGNPTAKQLLDRYFEPVSTAWRGLGEIPESGLALREEWADFDASRIEVDLPDPVEPEGCRCGEVLKGVAEPDECPLFAGACTPETPVGACMVSSEGACAAWHRHHRTDARSRR